MLVRRYYMPVAGWYDISGDSIDVVYYNDRFNDPPFETQTLDMSYEMLRGRVVASDEDLLVPKGPSSVIAPDNKDIPMFLVKATYLKSNEAAVLGVNYHHSLMDGSAFWMFLNNWAHVCKQICERKEVGDIPYPPTFEFPDIAHLRDADATNYEHPEFVTVDTEKCTLEFKPGQDKIKENILIISPAQQQEIRKTATEYGVSFTAMLCGMFWKEINDIRFAARPSIGAGSSMFTCAVNPRSKLGIPSTLCSSPVINVALTKPVQDVAKLALRDAVQLIDQTINAASPAYICSSLDHLLKQRARELEDARNGKMGKKTMFAYIHPASSKCAVSSSRNFPIYKVDFGYGIPSYVRPPYLPFDGCMRIWPRAPHKAVDDTAGVAGSALEIYLSQPEYVDLSKSSILSQFLSSSKRI
ncbi:hypothetical protein GGI12_002258 [Dipsacomyces acuminosporus]|nr:hypothetical protein GGI12_002258 [Dipsacomyces acuminosporus]